MKQLHKICPNCNKNTIVYTRQCDLTRSKRFSYICSDCKLDQKKCPNPYDNPKCKKYTTSNPGKCCRSCASYGKNNGNYGSSYYQVWIEKHGKEKADEMNKEVGKLKARNGKKNGMFGKTHNNIVIEKILKNRKWDDSTKEKQRMSAIRRIERTTGKRLKPSYSIEACKIIEQYGKEHGYNFQHAKNRGEVQILGYFVDGYDKEKNVVIEIDEKHHFKAGKLRKRDIVRQREIENYLECDFIRIKI